MISAVGEKQSREQGWGMFGWGRVEILSRLVRKGLVKKQSPVGEWGACWGREAASGRRAPGVFRKARAAAAAPCSRRTEGRRTSER